ncbi:PREDICTED: uncharacterized protein LOC108977493 [Bactrocera latifrons]|uniref:uncharacterized protein LOC108977493 n=1 Tax=Bactrocera latifrons TaxID=174628 RepID=UPI0008DDF3F5|nr:PREDICTED: uncharacterized protein LOC108977493 [Bactrocera latifrons]
MPTAMHCNLTEATAASFNATSATAASNSANENHAPAVKKRVAEVALGGVAAAADGALWLRVPGREETSSCRRRRKLAAA